MLIFNGMLYQSTTTSVCLLSCCTVAKLFPIVTNTLTLPHEIWVPAAPPPPPPPHYLTATFLSPLNLSYFSQLLSRDKKKTAATRDGALQII